MAKSKKSAVITTNPSTTVISSNANITYSGGSIALGSVAIGSTSIGYATTGFSSTLVKKSYHIMGNDYEIDSSSNYYYSNNEASMFLASLNCIGWEYYTQCLLNNFTPMDEPLFKLIDSLYESYLRDKKINDILETNIDN